MLRPKSDGRGASFYAIVTHATRDQDFAQKRQLFIAEQGYTYEIIDVASLLQAVEDEPESSTPIR